MGNCCCRRGVPSLRCDTVDMFLLDALGLPDDEFISPGAAGEASKKTWEINYAVRADADCAGSIVPYGGNGSIDHDDDGSIYICFQSLGYSGLAKRSADDLSLIWQVNNSNIGHHVLQVYCVDGGVVVFDENFCSRLDTAGEVVWTTVLPDRENQLLYVGARSSTIYYYFYSSGLPAPQYYLIDWATGSISTHASPSGMVAIYRTINNLLYVRMNVLTEFGTRSYTMSFTPSGTLAVDYSPMHFFGQGGHHQNQGKILNSFELFEGATLTQGLVQFDVASAGVTEIVSGNTVVSIPDSDGMSISYSSNTIYAFDEDYLYPWNGNYVGMIDRDTDTGITAGNIRCRTPDKFWPSQYRPIPIGSKYLFMTESGTVKARDVNFPT